MESCVVEGHYKGRDTESGPETVIELWCRDRQGHSVLLLVTGVRPWLEISLRGRPSSLENIDSLLDSVRSLKGVSKVCDSVDKWSAMGVKPHWRVEVGQPWEVPKLRKSLETDWALSNADIPFINRFFIEYDLGPHITAECEVLWASDKVPSDLVSELESSGETCFGDDGRVEAAEKIRQIGGSGLYPVDLIATCHYSAISKCEPFSAPFVLFSFDLETSITEETILCAAAVAQYGDGSREIREFKGDEEEILSGLTRFVRESDPDIITGYNIDNFDLPRLFARTRTHARKSDVADSAELFGWGRVPILESEKKGLIPEKEQNRRTWRVRGRCVLDAWWQARQTLRPKRETLKYVCQLLWPDNIELHKMDVDASKMDKEWAKRPDVVMKYCVQDTILPLEILGEISAVKRKEALAAVASTSLGVSISGTTSQWIDSLVIRLADSENIAVPRTNRGGGGDQIAGGYVHEVEAGVYRWIAVLDFKSMYPSIMISNNICYTTRIDEKARPDEVPKTGFHESPLGAKFLPAETRRGLIPRLLENLMQLRAIHKEAAKAAHKSGDKATEHFHDQMQYAVKILMNSFYGVFASKFYRFTHEDLGSSITAWARSNIKSIIKQLDEEGHHVVYSDTDSVFVEAPVKDSAPVKEPSDDEDRTEWVEASESLVVFGHELAKRFTKEGAELEFETGLSSFFSHGAKKRYVGQVIWPETKLLIRGYEVRRTDSFTLLTDAMTELFEMILDGESTAAVNMCIALIKRVRSRDVRPRDLVISKSCKGKAQKNGTIDFNSAYVRPDSMVQVRVAKQRIAAGLNFTPGMKVGWLVTDFSQSPMKVVAWLEDETGEVQTEYDPEFYVNRLAIALGRITEAFGWSADDLKRGNRQSTIFSF
ncbi:MAG: hypothetical protein HOE69_01095 [Euryarchaeota archaeon]|nr:hypothetical protein [Euryarchaeota archaeon]